MSVFSKKQEAFYRALKRIIVPHLIVCKDRTRVLYPNGLCVWRSDGGYKFRTTDACLENPNKSHMVTSCYLPLTILDDQVITSEIYKSIGQNKLLNLSNTIDEMKRFDKDGVDYDTHHQVVLDKPKPVRIIAIIPL